LTLTLREEQRLRVYEKRMLRILGRKRDEVKGGWRKPHNEEFENDQVKENGMDGHLARIGENKNEYRLLVGKPEGKRNGKKQDVGGWIILS
jgi:hypothetical protein